MKYIKKKIIIIPVLAIILIAIFISIIARVKNEPKYLLDKVGRKTIVETVEASGTIKPVQTVSIGSQVSGMIKEIYVDFNSQVKKGQLLAQIDPSLFQAQVDKSRGDLNAAKANYQKTKSMLVYDRANYLRYKKLYEKRYVSKDELDLARANYLSKSAELNSMNALIAQTAATLQNNLTNLRYTRIISPVDGVVVSREVDVGQTVAASFQTPTLFSVAKDLTEMQIEVSVSEADIGKVKAGQSVDYTLDGYPNETFKGTVTQVRISPTTVSNVVTYTVIVGVNNDTQILKPGMTANVSIITNKKENTICVDNAALRFTPAEITGGKKFKEQGIWLLRRNKPTRINIKTGVTDSEFTEIISNEIQEGEDVIIGNSDKKAKTTQNGPPRMF
ncbi:MAG: efflux RND transporter periplasmic adaptor subunit [Candidatus Gastranaerophilaceae bacterium]